MQPAAQWNSDTDQDIKPLQQNPDQLQQQPGFNPMSPAGQFQQFQLQSPTGTSPRGRGGRGRGGGGSSRGRGGKAAAQGTDLASKVIQNLS